MNKNSPKGWMNTEKRTYSLRRIAREIFFDLVIWFLREFIPQIIGGIREFVMEKLCYCKHELEIIDVSTSTELTVCLKCNKHIMCDYLGRIIDEEKAKLHF